MNPTNTSLNMTPFECHYIFIAQENIQSEPDQISIINKKLNTIQFLIRA